MFTPDGLVLTNAHVVAGARGIEVLTTSGLTLAADVLGVDPHTDIALLRVANSQPLPVLELGSARAHPRRPARRRDRQSVRLRMHGHRRRRQRARTQPARDDRAA